MLYFVVDAFTDTVFKGNPAGVCVLDAPVESGLMQKIAFENNLSDTAFLLPEGGAYRLRWFTPLVEVDLCGHATLASGFVAMNILNPGSNQAEFHTHSGTLYARRDGDAVVLDFPSRMPVPCAVPEGLEDALGARILETHQSRDTLVLVESEAVVRNLKPDMAKLKRYTDTFAFIVTAEGEVCDFVSRFFGPNAGFDEDPVTGSAHATLTPFWAKRLHKTKLDARQLSLRGGVLRCEDKGDRVLIGGNAVCYSQGEILL